MLSLAQPSDGFQFVMPNGPLGHGSTEYFDLQTAPPRFRRQKPSIYLIADLFTAGYMGGPSFVTRKPLAIHSRTKKFFYTGQAFDQFELDLLLYCVLRTDPQAGHLRLDPGSVLHTLHLRNDARNRDRLCEGLIWLHSGSIEIVGPRYRYMTRLVNRMLLDDGQRSCLVEVNADVLQSLNRSETIRLDVEERFSLGRQGLAKWLHGMLMVYSGGFAGDLGCLQERCGLGDKPTARFTQELCKALDTLEACGAVGSYALEGRQVRVCGRKSRQDDTTCGVFLPNTCQYCRGARA